MQKTPELNREYADGCVVGAFELAKFRMANVNKRTVNLIQIIKILLMNFSEEDRAISANKIKIKVIFVNMAYNVFNYFTAGIINETRKQ